MGNRDVPVDCLEAGINLNFGGIAMNYTILEQQTNGGQTAVLTQTKSDINEAEQAYHNILAYAAVSSVEVHSAAMLNQRGQLVKYECYTHIKPEPDPEPEESTA